MADAVVYCPQLEPTQVRAPRIRVTFGPTYELCRSVMFKMRNDSAGRSGAWSLDFEITPLLQRRTPPLQHESLSTD